MISVVVPLFNKEKSIISTVKSVLAQSYDDFELIIVDDGSTDNSLQVVNGFKDQRIRIFTKENGGVSSARNYGISNARGEYVAFLDADDLWSPNYLEVLSSLFSDFPDAVIWGTGYSWYTRNDNLFQEEVQPFFRGYLNENWEFPFFYWTSATACKSSVIKGMGCFDERITYGEDCDMWYRMLLEGRGVLYSKSLAYYNQDAENRLTSSPMPLEKHIPAFIDKYQKAREDNPSFRKFFDEQMVYRLYPYLFDKMYRKQAKSLGEKLDYSQLKRSMKFRMKHPYLYKYAKRVKRIMYK